MKGGGYILVGSQGLDKSFSSRGGVADDGEAGGEGSVVEVVVVGDGVAEVEDYWLGHSELVVIVYNVKIVCIGRGTER